MSEEMMRLGDEALDKVSGGSGRIDYTDAQLKRAGVSVTMQNGKKIYKASLSNGKTLEISRSVAFSVADCYDIAGGAGLSDQQLVDLIQQS